MIEPDSRIFGYGTINTPEKKVNNSDRNNLFLDKPNFPLNIHSEIQGDAALPGLT